ncbi:AAA family ATPase [Rothia dentocariosa]|uniref:AAA family ATPase n=1 Tax=Rothia dentocariosa TaxID=2047 RepID=UPI003C7D7681
MLLEFSVENFRGFKDEAIFSMTKPSFKTILPKNGQSWADVVVPVAGIFGANASGKTTLLEAMMHLARAVAVPGMALYLPYKLGPVSEQPTKYSLDFVVDGVRYAYTVHALRWGIGFEELLSYPKGTARLLFRREQESRDAEMILKLGSTLKGITTVIRKRTKPTRLFLGVAYREEHAFLEKVARGIALEANIEVILHSDFVRDRNLAWVTRQVAENPHEWSSISQVLANAADLGIVRVEVDEEELDSKLLEDLKNQLHDLMEDQEVEIPEELVTQIRRSLIFFHRGEDGKEYSLSLREQSDGTKSWLALSGQVFDALKNGKVLIVDELDSGLHSVLVAELARMFGDSTLNKGGAQLIFNSHDTTLLGNAPTRLLQPWQVWFTEKKNDGSSELYSLQDFDTRAGNNEQKRYLAGGFGAIPSPNMQQIYRYMGE